ncbi:hypothetical protein LTR36_001294 [Oleoguttula mirabilis]|uniref:Glycylpeptide N-tetradecanoyltransferase n=1 Tax=Oleoguttula mirabilis TaxID=1507867 RepID=A0AAV9JNV8_9PEZI|nr:hypothetical protein LTR36_001294 [Oleoguttula mirabilis]
MADGEEQSKAQGTAEPQLAADRADNKALDGPSQTAEAAESLRNGVPEDGEVDADVEGEDEEEDDQAAGAGAEADAEGASKAKKKRKPKKKKKKAVDPATATAVAATEPKAHHSSGAMQKAAAAPAQDIQALLQQLAMSQPAKKEGKAPEDYKFWNTQPVPKFQVPNLLQTTSGENGEALPEGPILPDKVCKASAKPEPEKLLEGFEWCLVDLEDPEELQELYDLLYNHYVEDTDGSFRFNYSTQFLAWALKPPGWRKDWHIGVRAKPHASSEGSSSSSNKKRGGKLVAFIAGIPVTLKVRGATLQASEINFLTIHRKLRAKRLAPVLIKEVTRRCYHAGVYQALYTAGTLLPTPISTCRYFHRSLDWEHLYNTGFSHMPPQSSLLRQKAKYKLDAQPGTQGLRLMRKGDVPAVRALLARYLERFHLRQEFSEAEVEHWLCSPASKDVVWCFVVEDEEGKVTDFVSYYLLESTVLRGTRNETIRAAYLYYYATDAAFPTSSPSPSPSESSAQPATTPPDTLKPRLQHLIHDALILAKQANFHVFNAVTLLDNPLFFRDQKFEPGDGRLHYYLFNWRTAALPGGVNEANAADAGRMGGVGVVML